MLCCEHMCVRIGSVGAVAWFSMDVGCRIYVAWVLFYIHSCMLPITSRSFTALARLSINSRVIELTGGLVVHTFIRVYECKCIVYVNIFRSNASECLCLCFARTISCRSLNVCTHIKCFMGPNCACKTRRLFVRNYVHS